MRRRRTFCPCTQATCFEPFIKYGGFNEWAMDGRVVVLYPYIDWGASAQTGQEKSGCYDGYGQTGRSYDQRGGAQMRTLRAMIKALAGV